MQLSSYDLHENRLAWIEAVSRGARLAYPVKRPIIYASAKRVVDVSLALIGCLVLLALMPIIWLCNRFTSAGELFFKQQRVGKYGEPFEMIKFRSMTEGEVVTGIGRFLRVTHLDELPQCWNVLRGDMSIIGPRPEQVPLVAEFRQALPLYALRHAVQPGLTGWAQVHYRHGTSVEDTAYRLGYDLEYIENQGWLLDTKIILRTVYELCRLRGR